ncbi:MAG: hypothetical protein Q9159_000992 [Coniocarpon cinnabarinum]
MALRGLIIALGIFCRGAWATLTNTGTTVNVNGVSYYLPGTAAASLAFGSLSSTQQGLGPVPVTVVNSSDVTTATASFASDDVWQPDFLQGVIIQGSEAPSSSNGSSLTIYSATTSLPNGPYVLNTHTLSIYQAWRLYSDFEGAFTETVVPDPSGSFSILPANLPGQSLAVAVPSRLYYTATPDQPLAGVRIGIKDIYDVAGVKTGDGNRAWYEFHPAATTNSVPVQRLVDAGAIIVGKMKTSQFANGETATADWVDYHEPFNPRGDGYQDTSSSSAGPGAAQGAYSWLDISLGSDTGGSIRGPSDSQGLFGNRPTHGLVDLTGVMPLAPELDTAGFLTRDPVLWRTAAQVLYGGLPQFQAYPKQILTVDFPTNTSDDASAAIVGFANSLASYLGTSVTPYNISEAFANNTPPESPSSDLEELLNLTYPILIAQDQTRLLRDPFYAAYGAANDGRRPFVDPAPLVRWAFGDSFPDTAANETIANKTVFMNWFESNVLIPDNSSASCSDKILLYVGTDGSQTYRNTYRGPPSVPYGFGDDRISVFSEAPDFVVPVGEASYNSTITDHEEVLPVTVDMMVARGCDGMLFDLINDLVTQGILKASTVGRSWESGGDILFKRSRHWQ